MVKQLKRQKKIEKGMEIKKRETIFREGVYVIRHPFIFLFKPMMRITFNHSGTKVKCEIRWLRKKINMKMIKLREQQIIFGFTIDIFELDMVINFSDPYTFEAFIDTPVGHLWFSGYHVDYCYGDEK